VILSAPRVTPAQEALLYAVYSALLWAVVITTVTLRHRLRRTAVPPRPAADYAAVAR
jgi:hypothetical protein